MPSVIAVASAMKMPPTSSRPKPRTIGTGETPSTRKPAAVAAAAIATAGAPVRATWATAATTSARVARGPARSSIRACSWMA